MNTESLLMSVMDVQQSYSEKPSLLMRSFWNLDELSCSSDEPQVNLNVLSDKSNNSIALLMSDVLPTPVIPKIGTTTGLVIESRHDAKMRKSCSMMSSMPSNSFLS